MRIICLLRGIWYSFLIDERMSGCNYRTDSEPTPSNVHALRCATCGDISVTWDWSSIEHLK